MNRISLRDVIIGLIGGGLATTITLVICNLLAFFCGDFRMSNACSFLGEQQWHRAILVLGFVFLVSSVGIGTFSHVQSQLMAIDSHTFRRLGRLALSLHAVSWCLLLLTWLWSWTGSACDHYSNLDLSMNVAIQVRNRIDSAWLLMNLFGLAAVSVWPLSWQPKPIVWPWLLTVSCQGCVGALVFAAELRLLIFGEFWASSDVCYVFVDGANFATVNLLIVLVLSPTAALYVASHRMIKEVANKRRRRSKARACCATVRRGNQ